MQEHKYTYRQPASQSYIHMYIDIAHTHTHIYMYPFSGCSMYAKCKSLASKSLQVAHKLWQRNFFTLCHCRNLEKMIQCQAKSKPKTKEKRQKKVYQK